MIGVILGFCAGRHFEVFIRALVVQGEHSRVEDSPFLSSSYDFTTEENGHPWFSDAWKGWWCHICRLSKFSRPQFSWSVLERSHLDYHAFPRSTDFLALDK